MAETVEIRLPPRPEYVGAVRLVFGAFGRIAELSGDSVEDLKLAVSEAVTNALTREVLAGRDDEVRIVATRVEDGVILEVTDAGPGVPDPGFGSDADEASSEEFSFETGLSLPVVRGLVEDLEIETGAESGLTVRFRVRAEDEPG
jgi:serine/threonine-protein kinase RsbW